MFGHPAEDLLWAPDPRDDLAFTMYAMDCEHCDAYSKAVKMIQGVPLFGYVDDVIGFIESEDMGVASQLNEADYVNLFNSHS